jgi:hypothetical protein
MENASSGRAEEPEQRCQRNDEEHLLHSELFRLAIVCTSLLLMILAFALLFLTKNIFPLFITMVVTYLFQRYVDTSPG